MADGQELEVLVGGDPTGTALEVRAQRADTPAYSTAPPKVLGGLLYADSYSRLAKTIHSTEMVPKDLQGRPAAILAIFMRGYEMGLGPMQALDSFHVIQGKVGLKAEAMRALILQQGHGFIISEVWDDSGIDACVAECRRADWPEGKWLQYRYGLDDARKDALVEWHEKWMPKSNGQGNYKATWNQFGPDERPAWVTDATRKVGDNWVKKPRSMLDARCTSGAARRWFADVLAGMSYTPEEVAEFDGAPSLDEQPPPSTAPAQQPSDQQPEGVSDFQHGGADAPSGDADAAPTPAAAKTAEQLDAERDAAVDRAKDKTTKAQGSTKKAASRAPAAKKAAAPPAAPAPDAEPPQERSEHLPSGELRVTQAMATQIHTAFHKMDPSFTRDAKLRYARNVLEDETIGSTWDMSVGQASELLDNLRIVNGDAPPHSDEAP